MAEDLHWPVAIVSAATVREADGLAYSSRNQYLTEDERRVAPTLYEVLQKLGRDLQTGKRAFEELEGQAMASLAEKGFSPEYVAIRRAVNLQAPDRDTDRLVILAAARLGAARLIDNLVVDI
jgi:pantoate--beta-alanine ligase